MLHQMKLLSQETLIFIINRLLANLRKLVQLPSLRLRHAKASGQIPISIKRYLAWKTLLKLSPERQPSVLILIEGTRDGKVHSLNASLKSLVETKYKNLAIAFYQPKTVARALQELPLFRLEENFTLSALESDDRSFGFISRICPGDLFTKDAFHLALVTNPGEYKQKELLLFGNQVIRHSNGTATEIALPTYGKVSQLFSHFINQGFLMSWPLAIKYSDSSDLTLNESLDLSLLEGLNENSNFHAAHLNQAAWTKDSNLKLSVRES